MVLHNVNPALLAKLSLQLQKLYSAQVCGAKSLRVFFPPAVVSSVPFICLETTGNPYLDASLPEQRNKLT